MNYADVIASESWENIRKVLSRELGHEIPKAIFYRAVAVAWRTRDYPSMAEIEKDVDRFGELVGRLIAEYERS